jgi:dihydropteroate synthase
MEWKTSHRTIALDRPLVMGILNVTPDSFSDGGRFLSVDDALRQAEKMVADGAAIIDVGGESTRPGSKAVDASEESRRVVPVIESIVRRFDVPISIDTTKAAVATAAMDAGAEIINDISGLRFDDVIADVAARSGAGLVLMHSLGTFDSMHSQPPVDYIIGEVNSSLHASIDRARSRGVGDEQIVVDPGIGFGKTAQQNLELLHDLNKIAAEFERFPILIGASRKSFIGKLLGGAPPDERLGGSIAAAVTAVRNGAKIVRVHDVKETVDAIKLASALDAVR